MFKISTQYGDTLNYSPRTYDTACRVAHFVRELGVECGVVQDDRYISEVFYINPNKDRYAKSVARRLV